MRGGLATSVVMHAVVLAWAMFTIQTQREIRMPELEPIAVDLVTPGDVTRLRQGVRTAKQLEAEAKETPKPDIAKKEAPKPTPVPAAPPPPEAVPPAPPKEQAKPDPPKEAEKVASVPPPAPTPAPPPPAALPPVVAPDAQKQLEEMLKEQEQERKAEEQRKAAEQKKIEDQQRIEEERKRAELKKKLAEEKKRKLAAEIKKKREDEKKRREAEAKKNAFDAEKMAALLNKIPDKGAPPPSAEPTEPTRNKGPALGAPEGRDRQLSASEVAILGQIIRSCVQPKWTILGGGEQAQQVEVKMRLRFHPDGRLAAAPQVTNMQGSPYFLAVSDSAIRAVQACEPFSLPPDKYDFWKDMILTFRPTDMF